MDFFLNNGTVILATSVFTCDREAGTTCFIKRYCNSCRFHLSDSVGKMKNVIQARSVVTVVDTKC